MAQEIQTPAIPKNRMVFQNAHFAWGSVLIGALMAAVYYRVLAKLVTDWWQIPDFSHGFLVPIFAAYLVWAKRKTLLEDENCSHLERGCGRCRPGAGGSAPGGLRSRAVPVPGFAGDPAGRAGALLWRVAAAEGASLRFAGSALAIPIPSIIFNEITLPLQILASKLASALLPLFGVPVLREGNVIELPAMKLEVAEACSGIRSLMSLFTLSIFYGYFLEKSFLRRVVLALASIPIAIAANAVRILGTGLCVQYWDPDKALGFFHEFSGWVMFLVSLGCLFIVHRIHVLVSGPKEAGMKSPRFWTVVLLLAGTALLLQPRQYRSDSRERALVAVPAHDRGMDRKRCADRPGDARCAWRRRLPVARLHPGRTAAADRPLYRLFSPRGQALPFIHRRTACPAPVGFLSRRSTSI
jgi:exosortase/archaeosortase family protein